MFKHPSLEILDLGVVGSVLPFPRSASLHHFAAFSDCELTLSTLFKTCHGSFVNILTGEVETISNGMFINGADSA